MNGKGDSPFTPGSPVPVELFVGRVGQIEELRRYVKQARSGKPENIFLTGDRGVGKTSLASFIRFLEREDVFGVHVFLGGVSCLEDMVCQVFDQLLKETHGQPWFEKVADLFGEYIKEVGLFGISVGFSPPKNDLTELVRNFPEALENLLSRMKDERRTGLLIVLDDINGLAERKEFADWYKSFADRVATSHRDFPVAIVLVGLPEKRDVLSNLQPSLMRIFRVIEIEKLTNDEVEAFLSRAFATVNMEVKPDAMSLLVHYASGLPILMHELGDAVFWLDTDGVIDSKDAVRGMLAAAERVGKKYLDPKVYRALRSERYRSTLRKLPAERLSRHFTRKEIRERLNERELKVFDNFLRRLKELGIIESDLERGRGAYRFANEIYPIYIWMESQRDRAS